jgi:lipopolysaccharide/colanic/teichoic acid biosynthesis glycosyltransferase
MQVRPGLSGVGSIAFRGEEDMMDASSDPDRFYDDVIMPYKGLLEEWYVANQTLVVYIKVIFVTAVVVLVPRSRTFWHVFSGLPKPPAELRSSLNWSGNT